LLVINCSNTLSSAAPCHRLPTNRTTYIVKFVQNIIKQYTEQNKYLFLSRITNKTGSKTLQTDNKTTSRKSCTAKTKHNNSSFNS
jgi:hypothetical protein